MTQIGGFFPATQVVGALGVHSLDHFSIEVPDLAVAAAFYAAFGLDVHTEAGHLALGADGCEQRWGQLFEGRTKRLNYLSFGIFEADLARFREHLHALGIEETAPPPGLEGDSIWIRDTDGVRLQLKPAAKSSPSAKSRFVPPVSSPSGLRGSPLRGEEKPVRPRRLSHVLIFVRDIEKSIRFYSDALGMRLSDEAGGLVAFMHGIHGSDHHMVAFAKSANPGFHHCSWDVPSIGDIGIGAMHMAGHGYQRGWGLGRHVLGSNYFHYVRDPWGSYSEYSADIDYIPADLKWDGQSHAPENSLFLWGPEPPPEFVINHESL